MSRDPQIARPADTILARRVAAWLAVLRAAAGRAECDLILGVAVLGLFAGLLGLGPLGGVLGLPLAAAVLARNIRPDIPSDSAATRAGRVIEKFGDALWFSIGAVLIFVPPFLLGRAVNGALFDLWGTP